MTVSLEGTDPELRKRIERMLKLGCGALAVSSARRTRADQERLYSMFLAGVGSPANRPGTSKHELGLAVDVETAWTNVPLRTALAAQCGLSTPINGEPWHMEIDPHWVGLEDESGEDDMQPVVALCTRNADPAARWVLVPQTSELRALDGAEFYGNVLDLPKKDQPDSVYGLQELPDRDGYMILGWKDGTPDWFGAFDAQLWADLQRQKG